MFGYVRPALDRLEQADKDRFQNAYCGLCHTIGRRYGPAARMFLSYDVTFLALLLGPACGTENRRCPAHPFRKRSCACRSEALDRAADYGVILQWWQLQDGVADHGFWKGLKYRAAALLLRRAYQKARRLRPAFDASTREQLERLAELERDRCPSLDRSADCFALLLAAASAEEPDPVRRRVLHQMLYHLGRWIYLVDAADDLRADCRSGSYNPVALRYELPDGLLTEEARAALGATLDQSVRQMAAAFELADFGPDAAVIRSVVYEGLYMVGHAVLHGVFHSRPPRKTP